MSEHEVTADALAQRERPLEIHRIARFPLAQGRAPQSFAAHVGREGRVFPTHHGEAGAVDGDAVALLQTLAG